MPRRDPADRTPQECRHDALTARYVAHLYTDKESTNMDDTTLGRRLAELDGDEQRAIADAVADWHAEDDTDDDDQVA